MANLKELKEKRAKAFAEANELRTKAEKDNNSDTRAALDAKLSDVEQLDAAIATEERFDTLSKKPGFETPKDKPSRRYSVANVMRVAAGMGAGLDVGYEMEVAQELVRTSGRTAQGVMIPFDQLIQRRANSMTVNAPGVIGVESGEFTTNLYPDTVLDTLGARVLTGLVNNVEWPIQKSDLRPSSKGETGAGSGKAVDIPNALATPHRVSETYPVSIQLLMQSNPSVEAILRDEITRAVRSKIEYMAFNGSGSDSEVLGILNLTGLGSYTNTGGTFSWANAVAAKKSVVGKGLPSDSMAWILGSDAWAKAASTSKDTGSGIMVLGDNGTIAGYKTGETDNVGAGNALLANMASIFMQYWGGIDIFKDEASKRASGLYEFVLTAFFDVTCTRPGMIIKNSVTIA